MLRKLAVGVVLFSVPALAQTIDGGQGETCNVDKDCGDICGWICSWTTTPHVCTPAVNEAHSGIGTADAGWCDTSADCACTGQTCVNLHCAPPSFANSSPQCICDTDCGGDQKCDQTLQMCEPVTSACNYDGQCGCGCFCISGTCECTGGIPQTCTTTADCSPNGCEGFSCVDGGCVHDEADCIVHVTTSTGSASSGGTTGASTGPGSTTGGTGAATTTGGGSTGGGTSGGASSTGAASSSGGTGGGCLQVGTSCSQASECCSDYCPSASSQVCKCNKPDDGYLCPTRTAAAPVSATRPGTA
jgi:hypothetical protein